MNFHITAIVQYILESFLHTWPYLLITIPIAVAVKMSGASQYINRAFTARPFVAILLATLVGAFSPLCSCSVIPVIAALLIGGVPLAPVMSFWIASPSMDPEIFFLSVSTLGWELAAWRLGTTLVMSLGGGVMTHLFEKQGWLGSGLLREQNSDQIRPLSHYLKSSFHNVIARFRQMIAPKPSILNMASSGEIALTLDLTLTTGETTCSCNDCSEAMNETCVTTGMDSQVSSGENRNQFWRNLANETLAATGMALKFMLLAWLIGAMITLYVPETWITTFLGAHNPWVIISAAVLGIPVYTSNLSAMPLVGGLISQGMNPGAALAFLIAGPTTTLPAMSAVWGIVNRRVFAFYVIFSMVSAIFAGYMYMILN